MIKTIEPRLRPLVKDMREYAAIIRRERHWLSDDAQTIESWANEIEAAIQ